mgnify:CR=1 FL=1
MHRNLHPSPDGDVIQRPLPLEPGINSLDGSPLPKEGLPFRCLLAISHLSQQGLVCRVDLDDRLGTILPSDKVEQGLSRVPFVANDVLGVELPFGGSAGLSKDIRSPGRIMGISRANNGRYRQFVFTVHQQMQLPAQDELGPSLGILLNRPLGLWVRGLGLSTVYPPLQRRGVKSYPFAKPWKLLIVALYQGARDILQQVNVFRTCQSCKEAAEGSFVGDGSRRLNPASLGDERVIPECANQRCGRPQPEHILCHEAPPKGLHRVSLGASAHWAGQRIEERGVVKPIEKGLKLSNDRGFLNKYRKSGIINVGHWKMYASFWLGAVSADNTCGPALFRTSVLLPS